MSIVLKDGSITEDSRLDRIPEFDEESRQWGIRETLTEKEQNKPRSYTWRVGHWLDQGTEGRCVEYAICHEMVARPVQVAIELVRAILATKGIYWPAQREDQWPGGSYPGASPVYEGTSVLAGMKVAARLGYFDEYRWAFGLQDVILAIAYRGPVVLGTNWYSGMRNTDANGWIRVGGSITGGHAYLAHSVRIRYRRTWSGWISWWKRTWADVDLDRSYVWIWNSWGPGWGDGGRAKLSLRDLDRLLKEQGEACIPVKRRYGQD